MISQHYGFIFVHVPKTAGNSIQNILRDYSEDEILSPHPFQDGIERFSVKNQKFNTAKHSFLSHYRSNLPKELYHSSYKFSTIRNPWDRMVSLYFSPAQGRRQWDRDEFFKLISEAVPVRTFIRLSDNQPQEIGNGATKAGPTANLDQDVDFLMRFENLDHDFRVVCRAIGVPESELPVRNVSHHEHYRNYYDSELNELVIARFRDEIEYGAYEF